MKIPAVLFALTTVALLNHPYAWGEENGQETQIEEILVVGVRSSLSKALDIKRGSDGIKEALVAEDIANFPDLNMGEALQRLTGITVERPDGGSQTTAQGEGAAINMRGLGPSFTRVEINGMTATNTGQERGFGFNLLASELFSTAIVSKSLAALDNEGGLAGTVQLATYKPLNYSERVVRISPQLNYGELSGETDGRVSFLYADQYNDESVGLAVGFAWSDTHRREDIADVSNWDYLRDSMRGNFALLPPAEQAEIQDLLIPRDPRIIVNDRQHERLNMTATLQFEPSDNLLITIDNVWAKIDHTGEQARNDFPIEGFPGTFVPADLQRSGHRFVSGTFPEASHFMRVLAYDYGNDSKFQQHVLSADWQATERLFIRPHIGYSSSVEDWYRWNSFDIRSPMTDIFYRSEGDFTSFTPSIGDPSDASLYTRISRIRDRPDRADDDELSLRLDNTWEMSAETLKSVDFGIRWAERNKAFKSFDGRANLSGVTADPAQFLRSDGFSVDRAPAALPNHILSVDFDRLMAAIAPSGFDLPERQEARYDVEEKTLAFYVQANFEFDAISGNLGLRYVSTDQSSIGFQRVTPAGGATQLLPASFGNEYDELLPTANLRWDPHEDWVIRLSYYRSLTRPALSDIQPARNFDAFDGGNGTAGNPELNPFTSDNFDFGIEWYFAEDALLSATYFSKNLNGLVERTIEPVVVEDPFTGQQLRISLSRPVNGEDAEVVGLELSFQSPFWFLPEPLTNTGVVLNYTAIDSEATFEDTTDIRRTQLPGLSESTYNAILYYDSEKWSVRAAYNWRSDYLLAVSGSGGQPLNRDDYGQVDVSATVDFGENMSFSLDIINLLEDQVISFSSNDPALVKGVIETGRQFVLGLNYQF